MRQLSVALVLIMVVALIVFIHGDQRKCINQKRVLIIGDSISRGYQPYAQKYIGCRAILIHAPETSYGTIDTLANLDQFFQDDPFDLIVWNNGLHDIGSIFVQSVTVDQYARNLSVIARKLSSKLTPVIFLTTTNVPENAALRTPALRDSYNAAARHIMAEYDIRIYDLGQFTDHMQNMHKAYNDVHYTPAGYDKIGAFVAGAIQTELDVRR